MNLTEPMNGTCMSSSSVVEEQTVEETPVAEPVVSKKQTKKPKVKNEKVKKEKAQTVVDPPSKYQVEENVKLYLDLLNLKEKVDGLDDSDLKTFLSSEFDVYIEFLQTARLGR